MHATRWAKKPGRLAAAAQDVDEDEVDARQQQRVEHEPELPEHGVEVLRAQLRPRQLERELAPPPHLAQVRARPAAGRRGAARRRAARAANSLSRWWWSGGRGGGHALGHMMGGRPARVMRHRVARRQAGAAARRVRAARHGSPAAPPAAARRDFSTGGRSAQCEAAHVEHAERQRQVAAGQPHAVAGTEVEGIVVRRGAGWTRVQDQRRRRRSGCPQPASMTRQPRSTPSWTKRNGRRPAARRLERPRGGSPTAPSHTTVMSLRRARSPTRSRGTQSRSGAPRRRAARRAAGPCPRPGRREQRRRPGPARRRRGQRGVVVEEEQQLAVDVAGRRRCARPGCPRRPRRARRARRPAAPSASQPLPTTTMSVSTPVWRCSDVDGERAARPGLPPGGQHARSRTSPQPLRGEDRQQVPRRGDRRDRDERRSPGPRRLEVSQRPSSCAAAAPGASPRPP